MLCAFYFCGRLQGRVHLVVRPFRRRARRVYGSTANWRGGDFCLENSRRARKPTKTGGPARAEGHTAGCGGGTSGGLPSPRRPFTPVLPPGWSCTCLSASLFLGLLMRRRIPQAGEPQHSAGKGCGPLSSPAMPVRAVTEGAQAFMSFIASVSPASSLGFCADQDSQADTQLGLGMGSADKMQDTQLNLHFR